MGGRHNGPPRGPAEPSGALKRVDCNIESACFTRSPYPLPPPLIPTQTYLPLSQRLASRRFRISFNLQKGGIWSRWAGLWENGHDIQPWGPAEPHRALKRVDCALISAF